MTRSNDFSVRLRLAAVIALLMVNWQSIAADDIPYATPDGILNFAFHLYEEGDYGRAAGEFLRYRFLFPGDKQDLAGLMAGMSFERAGDFEKALSAFYAVPFDVPLTADVACYETALTYLRMSDFEAALSFMEEKDPPAISEVYDPHVIRFLSYGFMKNWEAASDELAAAAEPLSGELRLLLETGLTLPRKSLFLSGLLSGIIPGLGKVYAERWKDGLFSFVTIGALAGLSVYNFIVEGVKSVKAWIYTSIGGILHIANIYGAVRAARDFNDFQSMRMEEELFGFIRSHY